MDHLVHLRQVFDRLRDEGLTIQSGKSQIGMTTCQFLGHTVGHGTITPQEAKLVAIRNYPQPSTKTGVRLFLGMTDYYHHFIPHFSSVAAPLTDLTKKAGPDPVEWTTDCTQAFRRLKELICTGPVLVAPDYAKTFILQTDASQRGIGAVLSQEDDTGNDHPVAFDSRKMLPWEQNYSATEQEGLAVVDAYKHFLPYLLGRPFIIQTDHRTLTFLNYKDTTSGRLACWMDILRQLDYTITYRQGKANTNADALSRQEWPDETTACTTEKEGGDVRST